MRQLRPTNVGAERITSKKNETSGLESEANENNRGLSFFLICYSFFVSFVSSVFLYSCLVTWIFLLSFWWAFFLDFFSPFFFQFLVHVQYQIGCVFPPVLFPCISLPFVLFLSSYTMPTFNASVKCLTKYISIDIQSYI